LQPGFSLLEVTDQLEWAEKLQSLVWNALPALEWERLGQALEGRVPGAGNDAKSKFGHVVLLHTVFAHLGLLKG